MDIQVKQIKSETWIIFAAQGKCKSRRRNCHTKRNQNLKIWTILNLSILQKNEKGKGH